jgi:alanyl-tRNA synthetase
MTERLYDNGLLLEFEAKVVSCREKDGEYLIELDRTAFAPEGGGQPSDIGEIDGVCVCGVTSEGENIYHICGAPLEVGKSVFCRVDEKRRIRHVQNHTGEHIVSGIIYNKYGYSNVGFHLGSEDVTMDVDGDIDREALREIEYLANKAVAANLKVNVVYPKGKELEETFYRSKLDLKENVRVVTVDGLDACACCAPHVNYTGEIGMIKLIFAIRYKGGTRIHLKCGFDALDEFNAEYDRALAISNMISLPRENIAEGVKKLMDDISAYRREIYELKKKIVALKAESLVPKNGKAILIDEGMEMSDLRSIVASKLDACEIMCAAFSGNDTDGYTYVIGYKGDDFNEFIKNTVSMLGKGGGGGKAPFAQGKVKCKKSDIERILVD